MSREATQGGIFLSQNRQMTLDFIATFPNGAIDKPCRRKKPFPCRERKLSTFHKGWKIPVPKVLTTGF